jgi:hypothetical protein
LILFDTAACVSGSQCRGTRHRRDHARRDQARSAGVRRSAGGPPLWRRRVDSRCSALAASERGRIGVSGPEVIETNRGVEEFDAKDRALVWRTMGGKNRRIGGGADAFADDTW